MAKALRRRLDGVRAAGMSEAVGKIVVIRPDDWLDDVRDAYDAACAARDEEMQDDIIEAQTGERPVYPVPGLRPIRGRLPPAVIAIRYVPTRPQ